MSHILVSHSFLLIVLFIFSVYRYFKYYRLAALSYVVKHLENEDTNIRLQNEYLTTGAIVAYQFNAIIYRPAEGRAEKVLLEAACQHVLDENGCSRPNLYDRGCYFLSDIVKTNKSYRLPTVWPLDVEVLQCLYHRDSIEDIKAEFQIPQKRKKPHFSNNHPPSKRRKRTTKVIGNASNSQWSGGEWDTESADSTDMENDFENTKDGGSDITDEEDAEDTEDRSRQSGEPSYPHHRDSTS